jgi:hypothetical protein
MPSSTSGSDQNSATRALVLLLVILLSYVAGLEAVVRVGFPRINHYWRRILDDQRTAISLQPGHGSVSPSLLIVGNSLLLWAVDRESLKKELPSYSLVVFPIENTTYLDWYFGLHRLFAEGAHPDFVGVCLSTRHLMSEKTIGEPFAHSMMLESDLLAIKRAAHMDNTMMSNYFFAGLSSWLGYRSEIRNWLLQKIMPNIEGLTKYLPNAAPPMDPTDVVLGKTLPRLRSLSQLCREHGARFFLIVPPAFGVDDSLQAIRAGAARDGIPVVVPYEPSEMPTDSFQEDKFHLNANGAALFTERLSKILPEVLSRNRNLARNVEH